ncbi:hypothetical protein VNI00_018234 [Paramarasmius palmivorus]|uniref:MULE transposase domain-containing protein n=1 Tax=Paramarasmius palmivorus TaxID=297713 RepID=A0AAW0AYS6_9AGAR
MSDTGKNSEKVHCQRCGLLATQNTFPRLPGNIGFAKECAGCRGKKQKGDTERYQKRKSEGAKSRQNRGKDQSAEGLPVVTWTQVKGLLDSVQQKAYELHALVEPPHLSEEYGSAGSQKDRDGKTIVSDVMSVMRELTGYRWNFKSKYVHKSNTSITSYSHYCAQLNGEQTKNKKVSDPKKQRARNYMDRFDCHGYLNVVVNEENKDLIELRLTHYLPHTPYTDISIPEEVKEKIKSMRDQTAAKIWSAVQEAYPGTNLTRKQVYFFWYQLNENLWRLSSNQLESAIKVLEKACEEGVQVEVITTPVEDGISSLAFTFTGVLDEYGENVEELAMDSTWKTNALGYELYGFVAEANGQALPLAFSFTSTDGTAAEGAKERMLVAVLNRLKASCPNVTFLLHDKDMTELNACRVVFPDAKHQLCYWHAIKYVSERLAEDKKPAYYDPRRANKVFGFIDSTWAPGVDAIEGWIEEGVHEADVEGERPENIPLPSDAIKNSSGALRKTCRPPLMVLIHDTQKIPVYPDPPCTQKLQLPTFCPKEHRGIIVEMFRVHLHQHPQIPFNDDEKTKLTAEQIYRNAVYAMYTFCFKHNLSQPWAYLWNRWYNPKQWVLWARSADEAIPRLKTTMIVESLWRVIKHDDLEQYHRPRLDLVTHTLIRRLLPRVRLTLDYILERRRIGRPKALANWQREIEREWKDMSRCDEHRLLDTEIRWRKTPKNQKGRTERLEQLML